MTILGEMFYRRTSKSLMSFIEKRIGCDPVLLRLSFCLEIVSSGVVPCLNMLMRDFPKNGGRLKRNPKHWSFGEVFKRQIETETNQLVAKYTIRSK